MKTVTVGIITFNGAHRVHNLLTSIKKWKDEPDGYKQNILLLDDGSHDSHLQNTIWVAKHHNIPVILHAENRGISKSWNDICRNSNSDIIVLINDDILVSKNWLTLGLYFLEKNSDAGMIGWNFYYIIEEDVPFVLEAEEPVAIFRDPNDKRLLKKDVVERKSVPERVMASVGACFLFTREKYEEVGGFDERFVSFYEESDFGTSLTQKGYPSYMLPCPLLYHQWATTFQENSEVLNPAKLMANSRKAYIEKWGVDLDKTQNRFLGPIEPHEVFWLDEQLQPQQKVI